MSVTKDIRIKTGASTYDTRDIGAEAQYVDVSRDSNGDIIEDITAPGVVVASTEPLSETLGGLQEKLTFDATPTSGSNNPVTSGGIYNAIQADAALSPTSEKPVQNKVVTTALGNKIDLSVIGSQEPIGDVPSVPYTTGSYLVGSDKKLYRVTQDIAITDTITVGTNVVEEPVVVGLDRIQPIETELVDVNNIAGAKNFCPNEATTQTVTDITFTVNSDGTVTVSGTPAASRSITLNDGGLMMAKGSYTLSSGTSRVVLQAKKQSDGTIIGRSDSSGGYPATFTLAADTSIVFTLYTSGTSAISNIKAYPMCRMASDPDTTYVPYAMSNREATSQISNFANDLKWENVPYYTSYGTILSTTNIKKNKYLCVGYVNISTYSGGAVGTSFSIDAAYSQTIPMVARNTGTGATTFVDASVSSSGMYAVLPSGYDEIRGSFSIPLT